MLQLARLKLATRLMLAFGIVLLMSLAASGTALYELRQVQGALEDVVTDNNVKIKLNQDMAEAVHVVSRQLRNVVLVETPAERTERAQAVQKARGDYDKAWTALQKFAASEKGQALRQTIVSAQDKARPLNDKVMDLAKNDQRAEAVKLLLAQAAPATQAWQDAIDANIHFQEANNAEQFAGAQAAYARARNLLIAFAVVNLLVAVGLVTVLVRSIVNQLGAEPAEVADLASRIADADLSTVVPLRAGDQGSVMAAMARMQQQLTGIVSAVRGNAEGVATASAQIAQGTQDLSSRTEEQASALEETAATMEQLGSTVRSNADAARQASQLAQGASTVATDGGQVVGEVVTTMKDISDSSRRIMDIIGVIDGIAFQTNILALNAAVEAARAGEQGRGFAVVAGEVRSLAQRSADAAREVKTLITASAERVEQGTQLVDRAGLTMTEIVTSIRRVSDIVGEIASASVEQSSGVAQVGEAVTQMDQATQQNAALVEESAAAAESLKLQAGQLVQAVSVFRLAAGGAARPASPPAAARPVNHQPPTKAAPPRAPAGTAAATPARTPAYSAPATATAGDDWQSF